jgi:endonuclease G
MKFVLFIISFLSVAFTIGQNLEIKEQELDQLDKKRLQLTKEIEVLKLASIINEMRKVGYPKANEALNIAEHSAVVIGFNEKYKLAAWTFHQLLPDVIEGGITRSNDFRADPKLVNKTAVEADYFLKRKKEDGKFEYDGFGFDRGHLAPSADFRWSEQGLSQSYFYSNMTPQRPGFNRESWAEVEYTLRDIVENSPQRYFIITGPVLHDSLPMIERSLNKIPIPELHYKIIVDLASEEPKGMAFLMPNRKCEKPIYEYVVSIDSVEKITGLDFFPDIEDATESKIESKSDYNAWKIDKKGKDVAPLPQSSLQEGVYNTLEAKYHAGFTISVVGKVVSTKVIAKSKSTFLNLDQAFPNQIFTLTIWGDARKNFSYLPEEKLDGKYIKVTGEVTLDKNGVPSINVKGEKQIEIWE